jgi:hypothetical protein
MKTKGLVKTTVSGGGTYSILLSGGGGMVIFLRPMAKWTKGKGGSKMKKKNPMEPVLKVPMPKMEGKPSSMKRSARKDIPRKGKKSSDA